jgi:hypothetical protein
MVSRKALRVSINSYIIALVAIYNQETKEAIQKRKIKNRKKKARNKQ